MGRLIGARNADDYFGSGLKTTAVQNQVKQSDFQQHNQEQQQSGFRRIFSLFKSPSQEPRQPAEGPSGSAASSFLLAWRSTRVPADILTVNQSKSSSVSFASHISPRWESVATDVVSAASKEFTERNPKKASPQLLHQHAPGEQERTEEHEVLADHARRQQHALRLQELQRQATLKTQQQAVPLCYQQPASLGRAAGEAEMLRLGPSNDSWQIGHLPLTPALLSFKPAARDGEDEQYRQQQQQQLLRLDSPSLETSRLSFDMAGRLQTQTSTQTRIPMPPPSQKPQPLQHSQPPSQPQMPPPQQQQQQQLQQLLQQRLDSNRQVVLRLPPFGPGLVSAGAPGLWDQPGNGGTRVSLAAVPSRLAPVELPGDLTALAIDVRPRLNSMKARTDSATAANTTRGTATVSSVPNTIATAGESTTKGAPPVPISVSCRSLGGTALIGPPLLPPPQSNQQQLSPLASPSSLLAASVSPSVPGMEVTLLALTPAAPASPTMEIILGAAMPRGAAASALRSFEPPQPPVKRSIRTFTGSGCAGGRGVTEGLGTPSLTAAVALATGADLRVPLRRVSTPGTGGGGGGGAIAGDDALARRTALLRGVVSGIGSMRRTLQSLQSLRHSTNGAVSTAMTPPQGEVGRGTGAVVSSQTLKPTSVSMSGAASEVTVPSKCFGSNQQHEPSASVSSSAERSNWEHWKNRNGESNWGLWKSQSNLSSRVRHDLEKGVMEEQVTAAAAAVAKRAITDSGANSPCTGAGGEGSLSNSLRLFRWKQVMESTAAALEASDGPGACGRQSKASGSPGRSGSPVPNSRYTAGGAIGPVSGPLATVSSEGGGNSGGSCDGTAPPRGLARAATTRQSRPATPAAKTGRILVRATSQPPNKSFQGTRSRHETDDGDGKSGYRSYGARSESQLVLSDGSPPSTGMKPRAGRRAPAPSMVPAAVVPATGAAAPPLPSRLSNESSNGGAEVSPRMVAVERMRDRPLAGMMMATAAPLLSDGLSVTSPALAGTAAAGVDDHYDCHVISRSPSASAGLGHHRSINVLTPAQSPRASPGRPSPLHNPAPVCAGASPPLTPAPPVPYRVSLLGNSGGNTCSGRRSTNGGGTALSSGSYDISQDVLRSAAVQHLDRSRLSDLGEATGSPSVPPIIEQPPPPPPPRVSFNGVGVNPRSRRMLFAAGGYGEHQHHQHQGSGLVPVPPPAPREPDSSPHMA